ncbi:TM2 domain-containing protein [Congregibacter litoralis]|uniref:TM2 domain protein n=1 Tax=Congregibacter litoralis KT71 TaxID=314285 RepID=A4A4Y8_9GAMM|nr:TM2 domain-containing protein [Congregibacter litoralis]EAQ98859.1 TM2 domain protein [Congregibacter litoralis KT71]
METKASHRDADFSRAVLEDLYRYPKKRAGIAWFLWATTGLIGGHRFYLDRPATALTMAFTAGGALLWWLVDAFLMRTLLESYNDDQAERERRGQPPRALAFMPPSRGAALPKHPAWIAKRQGHARLFGDVLVLALAGIAVGSVSTNTGNYEPIIAIVALSAITLLGARWDALATIPVLKNFDRWSHRLRLYYYVNDPGGPLTLFFKPVLGLLTAPFRKRARAEAWLYLQIGLWFTIIFTGMDLVEAVDISSQGISIHPLDFLADVLLTLISVYALATPIGAILTTHVLLERRDLTVWVLTCITLAAIYLGSAI